MTGIARVLLPLLVLGGVSSAASAGENLVLPGSAELQAERLPLGTETVRSFKIQDGEHTPTSTLVQTISRGVEGGRDTYVINSLHVSADGDSTRGTIVIRGDDFSLLRHKVTAAHDSMAVSCSGDHLTGWVVLPDQEPQLFDLELTRPVFPVDGPSPWFLSLLPLADGYAAVVPRFSPWAGTEEQNEFRVLGSGPVEHRGETRPCGKVDTGPLGPPGYRAVCWVDRETQRILKGVLAGPPGQVEYLGVTD